MIDMKPTVGRIVHYMLTDGDAAAIKSNRTALSRPSFNAAVAGDVYPAVVVRVFDPASTTANLQVLLDGTDSYWATSRQPGDGPGHWSWLPST